MATTTGDVLKDYLGQQLGELRRHGPGALAGQPEAIHQMRVAARRLRSLLATGRSLLTAGASDGIRTELQWISGVLGAARDPTVVEDRLRELLAEEPPGLVVGPAAERINESLDASAAAGMKEVIVALEGERYAALLERLSEFIVDAPWTAKASRPPETTVRKLVAKDEARLRRAVDGLAPREGGGTDESSGSGAESRDAGLHEIRKSAKRLRYAAEFAATVSREKDAKRLAKTAAASRKIQTALGLHQDSVVAQTLLSELGRSAAGHGEAGFTFGRLHAREGQLAARAEADFAKAWKKFPAPR